MNDPFYDIKEKIKIDNDALNQLRKNKDHILTKADEAKQNKDYELEVWYLIHYIDIDAQDYEIYDRIVSRVLVPENDFKKRNEKLNFYVNFLKGKNNMLFYSLLNLKICSTEKKFIMADNFLSLINNNNNLTWNYTLKIVFSLLKYNPRKALDLLKLRNVNNFECKYLIEILTIAFDAKSFDCDTSLNNLSDLANNCEPEYKPLIALSKLICNVAKFLQNKRNLALLDQCFEDCKQILNENQNKDDNKSYFSKIHKTALNIKVVLLHNLCKIKSDPKDKIELNEILEVSEDIALENRITLLYHYNSHSEPVMIKIISLLKKQIDSFRNNINNYEQNKILYLNKENEMFFYYHSLFLYLKSEITSKKRKNEEILNEDDEFNIKSYENCAKNVKRYDLAMTSVDSNSQIRAKSSMPNKKSSITPTFERSKTNLQQVTKTPTPTPILKTDETLENENLSLFEVANYLNFIGWVYYNSRNEYDKAGDYFERARLLDQKFFKSKIFFYLKVNEYDRLINYIQTDIKEHADDEAYFYLAYAYFHKGLKDEAIGALNKLSMLNGLKDSEKFCDDFLNNELEYDRLTYKFKKNIPKYEFVENYIIEIKESFIINDIFDVILDVKLRLETNHKELKFNNEYFYLFKSKVELEKSNEYNKNSDDCIKKALCINTDNICSNSVKYMINLLKYNDKEVENNKIRDKKVENDHYLNYLFDIKQDHLDKYFSIIEYNKKNIFSLIKKHGLSEQKSSDFSELNENLMNIYNGNFDKVIKYINNFDVSEFTNDSSNYNDEQNANIISLNASIISLRKYIESKNEQDQKPQNSKNMSIAKIFYWLVYKLYENKNYASIRTVKLDIFDLLKDRFKFTTNNKHDIVYYLNELNYYLGVVYFRDGNFDRAKQFFDSYSLTETKSFYYAVKFYLLVLKKIKIVQHHNTIEKIEISKVIEEFYDLIKSTDVHLNAKYSIVSEYEVNLHQAQCYFYLNNFNACLDLLNEHQQYLNLVKENKNLAFNQDDVYFYKIHVWFKLEKYKEIKEFIDHLEQKKDFFNHQPEYVDLINYFRAVSFYKLRKEDSENRLVKYLNSSLIILDKIENKKFEFYIESIIFRIDLTHCLINIHLNNYIKSNEDKLELEKLIERFDDYILKLDEVVTDELIQKHKLSRIWEYKLFSLFYFNNYNYKQLEGFIEKKEEYKKYYDNSKYRNYVESFYLGLSYFKDQINFFEIFFKKISNNHYKKHLEKCEQLLKNYKYENETYKNLTTINKINLYFCRAILGILIANQDLSKDVKHLEKVYEFYEKDFKSSYYSDLYFIFDIRIEFNYYKSIALLKLKKYDDAENNAKKALNCLSEKNQKIKIDDFEKLKESIIFISSYILYKKNKEKNILKFDCELDQNAKYLKNEVNFYKAKSNLKNKNLEESIKYFNSIEEKKQFSRAHVLIKYKIECNYKLGIFNQQSDKKHGDKNEYLENTITLIDNNQNKLEELNDYYAQTNKDKRVNFDLYKAKCLYYVDNKDDVLFDFLHKNSNIQTNNIEMSADLEYLKGVAIMRYKIKTNEMFHYKMINYKQIDGLTSEIKEYIENLNKAKTHFTNYLSKQSNQNKSEKDLGVYDISVKEKLYTTKFYLAIIYQHRYNNNLINSIFHFAEIYRAIVNEIEVKSYNNENENTILKDVDEVRKILNEIFKNLSENKSKLDNLKLREFKKVDFCFYFAIALFKSKLYDDNRYSKELFIIVDGEANLELNKKTFACFFNGLINFKNENFKDAVNYLKEAKSALIVANFYYQRCLHQLKAKETNTKELETIYNSMRNILMVIKDINGLDNFTKQNLEDLFEVMMTCFFEMFKSSNEKKNLALNFKKSIELSEIKEEYKTEMIKKYNEKVNLLNYFSCVNKNDLETILEAFSKKENKTQNDKYFIGLINYKLYEMNKNETNLTESHTQLLTFFQYNSTDNSKINLLLNTKFYLIKFSFEKQAYSDLENIEKNLIFIKENMYKMNIKEKYLIDFDETLINFYLIKTYFYRKNYQQAAELLDVYIESKENLSGELKYIFNVCLVELIIKKDTKKRLEQKYDLNKSSEFYDNNQIHIAHYYFELKEHQKSYDLLVDIFNKVFHENADVKLKNQFEYEKYEYYLLITCLINSYFIKAVDSNDLNLFKAISEYCEKAIKFYADGIFYKEADSKTDMKENIFKKLFLSKYYSKNYAYLIDHSEQYFSKLAEFYFLKGASYYKESNNSENKNDFRNKAKDFLKKFIENYKYNKAVRVNVFNAYYFLILINYDEKNVSDIEPLNYIISESKVYLEKEGNFKKAVEAENPEKSILEFDLDEIYFFFGIYFFQNLNFEECLYQFDLIGNNFIIAKIERKNLINLYRSVCVYKLVGEKENTHIKKEKLNESIELLSKIDRSYEYYENSVLYLGIIYYEMDEFEKSYDTLVKLSETKVIKNLFFNQNEEKLNQIKLYEEFIVKSARMSAFQVKKSNYINNEKFKILKARSFELIKLNKSFDEANYLNYINFAWSLNFLEEHTESLEFFDDLKLNDFQKYKQIEDSSKVKDDFYFNLGVALFKKSDIKSIFKNLLNNRNSFDQHEFSQSKTYFELANKNLNSEARQIAQDDELIIWREKKLFINFYLSLIYSREANFEKAFSNLKIAYDFYFKDFFKKKNENSSSLKIEIKLDDIENYSLENLARIFNINFITELEDYERDIYYDILYSLLNIVFKNYDKNLIGINLENLEKFLALLDSIYSNMEKFNLTSRLNFVELVYFYKFKVMMELSQLKNPDLKKTETLPDKNTNDYEIIIEKLLNSEILEKKFDDSCGFYFETYYLLSLYYFKNKNAKDYYYIEKLMNSLTQNSANVIKKESLVEKIYLHYINILNDYLQKKKLTNDKINECLVKLKAFKENYSFVFKIEQSKWEKYKNESLKSRSKFLMQFEFDKSKSEKIRNDLENLIQNTFNKSIDIIEKFEKAEQKILNKQNKLEFNDGMRIFENLYAEEFDNKNYKNENDDFKIMNFKIVDYLIKCNFDNKNFDKCKRLYDEARPFLSEIIEKASLVPMISNVCISIINTDKDWSKIEELVDDFLNKDNVRDKDFNLILNFNLIKASLLYKKLDYSGIDKLTVDDSSSDLSEEFKLYKFAAGYWTEYEKLYDNPEEFIVFLRNNSNQSVFFKFFELFAIHEINKKSDTAKFQADLKIVYKTIEESKKKNVDDELYLTYYRNNVDYDLIKGLVLFVEKNYNESLKYLNSYTQFLEAKMSDKKKRFSTYPSLMVNSYKMFAVNKINEEKKELEKINQKKFAEMKNNIEQIFTSYKDIELYFNDEILNYIEKIKIKEYKAKMFKELASFYFGVENYTKYIDISKRLEDENNFETKCKIAISNYKLIELSSISSKKKKLEEEKEKLVSLMNDHPTSELSFHLFFINLLLENYKEALEYLDKIRPKPFNYEFNAGLLFFKQNKIEEAQKAFNKQISASSQNHLESFLYLLECERAKNGNKSLSEIYENDKDYRKMFDCVKKCDKALFSSNKNKSWVLEGRKSIFQKLTHIKKQYFYDRQKDYKFKIYISEYWRNHENIKCIQKALEGLGYEFIFKETQNSGLNSEQIDKELNDSFYVLLFLSNDYLNNNNFEFELKKMQEKVSQKKFCSILIDDLNSLRWPVQFQSLAKNVSSNSSLHIDFKAFNGDIFKTFYFYKLIEILTIDFEKILI